MPTLKNLSCHIQWANTNTPFTEYGTVYGDGVVETFIAVPNKPQPFNVRLTSKGFIYEGLAAVLFIDGTYQCNRNRVNLIPAKKGIPRERTEINFVMRQKEKAMGDGVYMGREWRFDDHNVVPDPPKQPERDHFDMLGTIEVIIMRCRAKDSDDTNASTVSSAAESRLMEDAPDGGENPADDGDGKSTKEETTAEDGKAESAAAPKDDDSASGGMLNIFDGAADDPYYDYRSHGYPEWHRNPPPQYSYPDRHYHNYYPSHRPEPHREYNSGHPPDMPYAPQPSRPANEKHVRWDHGPLHPPPPPPPPPQPPPPTQEDSYSDWNPDDRHSESHAPPTGYRPGLSEYQPHYSQPHNQQHGNRSQSQQYGTPHPASHQASHHPASAPNLSQGHRTPTHPHHAAPNPPPHYSYSHPLRSPPVIAKLPPQFSPSRFMIPPYTYQPPYPFYPGTSQPHWPKTPVYPSSSMNAQTFVARQNSSGPSSKVSPKTIPQEGTRPGSLDPAKEDNNQGGDGWGPTDVGNQQSNSSGANGWEGQGNSASNANANTNWQNQGDNRGSGNNNASDNNNWDIQPDNQNGNQSNDGADKGDSNNQDQGEGNNGGDRTCNQNSSNNNQQPSGDNNNQAANQNNATSGPAPAAADDSRGSQPTNFAQQTPLSSAQARSLFGPHGAYYAFQSGACAEVPCDAEEEPRYDVPQSFVTETGSSKQVQPGKGYLYTKKRCSPVYIDDMKEPYARFVFKYRTKDELKKDIDIELDVEPSSNEEVQSFQNMSKEDLIQMLVRAKGALGGRIPSPPPEVTSPGAPAAKGFEPIVVEPPDVSHLEYSLPSQRPAKGNGGNQPSAAENWNTTAATSTTPGAWPEVKNGTSPGGKEQNNWNNSNNNLTADNDTGGGGWGNADSNPSTNPIESWEAPNIADTYQTPRNSGGNGADENSWNNDCDENKNSSSDANDGSADGGGWDNNKNNDRSNGWSNKDNNASNDWKNGNSASGGWDSGNNNTSEAQNDVDGWDGATGAPRSVSSPTSPLEPASTTRPEAPYIMGTEQPRPSATYPTRTRYGEYIWEPPRGYVWCWYAMPLPYDPTSYDVHAQPAPARMPAPMYHQQQGSVAPATQAPPRGPPSGIDHGQISNQQPHTNSQGQTQPRGPEMNSKGSSIQKSPTGSTQVRSKQRGAPTNSQIGGPQRKSPANDGNQGARNAPPTNGQQQGQQRNPPANSQDQAQQGQPAGNAQNRGSQGENPGTNQGQGPAHRPKRPAKPTLFKEIKW